MCFHSSPYHVLLFVAQAALALVPDLEVVLALRKKLSDEIVRYVVMGNY